MPLLFFSGLCAVVFIILGFLTWLIARLLGKRIGRAVFKWTGVSYLAFLPLLIFVILPIVFSIFIARAGTRPYDQNLNDTPQTYGCAYREISFPSRDGVTLRGWYLEGGPDRPLFILAHGLFRNRHEVLERACTLNKMGYPALLFDFRNHGNSGRAQTSLGFLERLDVLGARDFAEHQFKRKRFIYLGVSMGAVAVILAAADVPAGIDAIIADSPFQSLSRTVAHHTWLLMKLPAFPFANIFVWNLTRIEHFDGTRLDTRRALSRIPSIPVLLIYGEKDRRMPKPTALSVYESVRCPLKQIIFFKNATHGAAYRIDGKAYMNSVRSFLASLTPAYAAKGKTEPILKTGGVK